jgi:hypothetical protein
MCTALVLVAKGSGQSNLLVRAHLIPHWLSRVYKSWFARILYFTDDAFDSAREPNCTSVDRHQPPIPGIRFPRVRN